MSHSISLSISLPIISPSHWSKTLGTDSAPSEAEASDIQTVISHANFCLSKVENEIVRVQEVLNQIYCRRDEICELISSHKALLSPVRRLPNEILAEIFIYYLPWFSKADKKKNSFRRDQAPLLVAQICSRWRAIVLSTQKLWSFIQIEYGGWLAERRDVMNMSLWLERSGTYPLSLVLRELNRRRTDVYWGGESMLDTILPSSNRWQRAEIHGLQNTIRDLSPIKDALPLLQSLSVRMYDPGGQGLICDTFEFAPALRSVDIGRGLSPSSFKLPWAHLTEFASHDGVLLPPECLDILRNCPNLTSCIFGTLHDHPIQPSTPPLRHSQLLNLHIPLESSLGGFFDCLTLPALRSVRLDSPAHLPLLRWPEIQFLDLLWRSSCTLQIFTWALNSVRIENIIRCLESMPDLEALRIIHNLSYSLPELLRSLSLGASDQKGICLCPKLQVIQLSVDHTLNREALSAFVRSRRSPDVVRYGAVRIKSIQLSPVFLSWEPRTALRGLKEFQDDGLDIFVSDSKGDWHQVMLG